MRPRNAGLWRGVLALSLTASPTLGDRQLLAARSPGADLVVRLNAHEATAARRKDAPIFAKPLHTDDSPPPLQHHRHRAAKDLGHSPEDAHADHGSAQSEVGLALSVMLLGTVGFVMALFYLVNYHDRDIRSDTWKMLNSTISIFAAVLLYTDAKALVNRLIWPETRGHLRQHRPENVTSFGVVLLCGVRCLCVLVVLQALLYMLRDKRNRLLAWGTLAAHIAGFAAIDFYGSMQDWSFFRLNVATTTLATVIAVLGMMLNFWLGLKLREWASLADDDEIDAEEAAWDATCVDAENDVAGLCLGLLISRTLRQAVTGELPPLTPVGEPKGKTWDDCGWLALICALLIAFVFSFKRFDTSLKKRISFGPLMIRVLNVTECVNATTAGWTMLFCNRWIFHTATAGWTNLAPMTAHQIIALMNSVLVIPAMFLVDYLADNHLLSEEGLRSLGVSFGLLVGLSWEITFDTAVENLEHRMVNAYHNHILGAFAKTILILGLCGVVLPAWRMYILPKALAAEEEAHEKLLEDEQTNAELPQAPSFGRRRSLDSGDPAFLIPGRRRSQATSAFQFP